GIIAARLVARPRPVWDGEDVVLRPFERLLSNARASLARDYQAHHVVGRAFSARDGALVQPGGVAIERRHDGATGRRVHITDDAPAVGAHGSGGKEPPHRLAGIAVFGRIGRVDSRLLHAQARLAP